VFCYAAARRPECGGDVTEQYGRGSWEYLRPTRDTGYLLLLLPPLVCWLLLWQGQRACPSLTRLSVSLPGLSARTRLAVAAVSGSIDRLGLCKFDCVYVLAPCLRLPCRGFLDVYAHGRVAGLTAVCAHSMAE
jgi:hypothetical protein